jgi:hypothetical protein
MMLDIDSETNDSTCTLCPENTFSKGGGDLFSGALQYWSHFTDDFETECYVATFDTAEEG